MNPGVKATAAQYKAFTVMKVYLYTYNICYQLRHTVAYLYTNQNADGLWGEKYFATSLSVGALNLFSSINVLLDPEKAVHASQLVDVSSGISLSGAVIDVKGTMDDAVSIKSDGSFTVSNLMGSLPDL